MYVCMYAQLQSAAVGCAAVRGLHNGRPPHGPLPERERRGGGAGHHAQQTVQRRRPDPGRAGDRPAAR